MKNYRFKILDFRFIAVVMLLLPMMVYAQPNQPSPFKSSLAGERPIDLTQKEKQGIFSGGVSADGLMNTGSTYSPNPEMFVTDGSETETPSGPHRTPPNPLDPHLNPIGDGVVPMMMLAVAFLVYRLTRRKKNAEEVQQK